MGISVESSPLQILQKFLTPEVIQIVVDETNRYAEQDKLWQPPSYTNWSDVDESAIWQFFATTFVMGLVKKPAIHEYWTTDPLLRTPFFSEVMSRNRYFDFCGL